MRTFTPPATTRFYAGVDLHARADAFLAAVAPFRDGLLVACECMHCWYRLANCCRDENIAFVLGHA
ncbi:MAG TPA: hypothetical protein VKD72_23405 [Gemmataceae bacterium]|nr:hypothetical protein [Gemmataceae bacterium]